MVLIEFVFLGFGTVAVLGDVVLAIVVVKHACDWIGMLRKSNQEAASRRHISEIVTSGDKVLAIAMFVCGMFLSGAALPPPFAPLVNVATASREKLFGTSPLQGKP